MQNDTYFGFGKLFFAIGLIGFGLVHLITQNFPSALLPVPADLPGRTILVYLCGIALIIAGVMMLINKYIYTGAMIAIVDLGIMFLFLHLPKVIMHPYDPTSWTPAFEVGALLSGAMIVAGSTAQHLYFAKNKGAGRYQWLVAGRYIFAASLIVFGVQHFQYAEFIKGLIPSWIPAALFWAYFVGAVFFAVALSILIRLKVPLAATLLAIMFFIWFLVLHIPRVAANLHTETEWTSLFNVLAMCGISLVIAGTVVRREKLIINN